MKKFRQVFVEITNVCNLDCSFCPKHSRAARFMSVDEFEHIANQLAPITRAVSLHLMGEPLLHPDFDKICYAAQKRGLQIYLTTNGTLLNENLDALKSGAIKRVSISLHSFEANALHQTLDQYLNNIFECAKIITQTPHVFVELRLWNEDGKNIVKNDLNRQIIDTACRYFDKAVDWNGLTNQFLTDKIYLCPDRAFTWPSQSKATNFKDQKHCHALSTHFGVLADGTVVACCLDNQGKLNLGNILSQPITEILNSTRAQAILNGFKEKRAVEPLCKACLFANKYSQNN